MNATPRAIADAHLIISSTADELFTSWQKTQEAAGALLVDRSWKAEAAGQARAKVGAYQKEMMTKTEAAFVELGMQPVADAPAGSNKPPFPKGWDVPKMQKFVFDTYGSENDIRTDLTTLATAVQASNAAINENFFKPDTSMPLVQAQLAALRPMAIRHGDHYNLADEVAQQAERVQSPVQLTSAAAAGSLETRTVTGVRPVAQMRRDF